MTIRVAAIEVSHGHALNDAAYLRHLVAMPDVELIAIQDSDAGLVAKRAVEVGSPPTFTDYRKMLATTRPDFVLTLGRHRQMAGIAHGLLDRGYPFLMEKPMGINAPEVEAVAAKAARLNAFVAVPLAQRYASFATRARELLAAGRLGPLSHIYVRINRPGPARYPAWDCALDARSRRGRRRLPPEPGPSRARHVPPPDRGGGAGYWRPAEPARARAPG
jgi:predicted dehydrogenase